MRIPRERNNINDDKLIRQNRKNKFALDLCFYAGAVLLLLVTG